MNSINPNFAFIINLIIGRVPKSDLFNPSLPNITNSLHNVHQFFKSPNHSETSISTASCRSLPLSRSPKQVQQSDSKLNSITARIYDHNLNEIVARELVTKLENLIKTKPPDSVSQFPKFNEGLDHQNVDDQDIDNQDVNHRDDDSQIRSRRQPNHKGCVFCKNNGQPFEVYAYHLARDPMTGFCSCPLLRRYRCPICKNPDPNFSHTVTYCPRRTRQN